MITIKAPTVLDDKGNLSLHAQQGSKLKIDFLDEVGNPVDMTNRTVELRTALDEIIIQLTPAEQAHEMYLTVAPGTFNVLLNRISDFILLDTTDTFELLWQGQLIVRGWE